MSSQVWLEGAIARHGAVAGTVHVAKGEDLVLAAHFRIPPPVLEKVAFVPHGKGMAGLAQTRREPVQTCNIKTDDTGTVKPVAKMVDANAAIAVPVLDEGAVVAVVGLAFGYEGDLPAEMVDAIWRDAAGLPR